MAPLKDACIKTINFKSEWKVFAVYQSGARLGTWGQAEQSKHTPDPCFVIENWTTGSPCRVQVNGEEVVPGRAFRQGIVHDTEGNPMMIIYLKLESASTVRVEATARPGS